MRPATTCWKLNWSGTSLPRKISRDRLSELLGTDLAVSPGGWPLRGELISHLDRLRTELEEGKPDRGAPPLRHRRRMRPGSGCRRRGVGW